MIRHVVRRGDSLWGLAGQYLGSGARWPEIHKFHDEFALGGRHPQLLPIKDPNLIFVGQTIFIPPRSSKPYTLSQGKPWPKVEVTKPATGLDLKVVYKIDDSQSQYKQVLWSSENILPIQVTSGGFDITKLPNMGLVDVAASWEFFQPPGEPSNKHIARIGA